MKNTKKYLSTGVALAIALFAAVQLTAMAPRVNPYLSERAKQSIKDRIEYIQELLNPKSKADERLRNSYKAHLKGYEEVYYGNQPYSLDELEDIIQRYKAKEGYQQ